MYSGQSCAGDNSACSGCSILEQNKPCHSVMDYEDLPESDTLFVSDSLRYKNGATSAFSPLHMDMLRQAFPEDFVVAASVKCPSVREGDLSTSDSKICRKHIEATVDKVKPKLIFACGNLAMKMLLKKSGITSKRGKAFEYESPLGHECVVVPIYHPAYVIKEPRHLTLFELDIKNGYEKYILCNTDTSKFSYKTIVDFPALSKLSNYLKSTEDTVAVDIETTGLNFLRDKIMTIGFSTDEGTWVVPVDHKDSPFKGYKNVIDVLRGMLENPNNKKVFHNAKFDCKFLINYGIHPKNVWDTKVMHHLIDENLPKGLMDLVKLYFASELESL